MRLFNKENRTERSEWCRLRKYNMTPQEYKQRLEKQNNKCACCGEPLVSPQIDHDHSCCDGKYTCGKCTRDVLCGRCNSGLGQFNDNIGVLEKAIEYLKKWKAKQ